MSKGYAERWLNKNNKYINEKNAGIELANKIDELYEKCFHHMKENEPYFKSGYDDEKSYTKDTIVIMQGLVDFVNEKINQNLDNQTLKKILIDLHEVLAYYNHMSGYRNMLSHYEQEQQKTKNHNLFEIDLKSFAEKLLGFETVAKKIPFEYEIKVRKRWPEQGYETRHYTENCNIYCKDDFAVNSISELVELVNERKVVIAKATDETNGLEKYDISILNSTPFPMNENDKNDSFNFINRMENIYPMFVTALTMQVRDSAQNMTDERILYYKKTFGEDNIEK